MKPEELERKKDEVLKAVFPQPEVAFYTSTGEVRYEEVKVQKRAAVPRLEPSFNYLTGAQNSDVQNNDDQEHRKLQGDASQILTTLFPDDNGRSTAT